LPKTLEKAIKTDTGFKERAIRADIALLQQKLDSQYNQDSGYRMSKEASKTAAELDRKVAELRGLK
jgi:DNA-binding transcriptional regulator PaaX